MNTHKIIQHKISQETSKQSEISQLHSLQPSLSRISSLKSLSIKKVPFSQHIFCDSPIIEQKVCSATQFNPERWHFRPFEQEPQKKLQGKKIGDQKNRFLQALRKCETENMKTVDTVKKSVTSAETQLNFFDEFTTYRDLKKRRNKVTQRASS